MRKIIIIGASHHNTLSMVRCIGEILGQIDLVLMGCTRSFVSKSKYVCATTYLKDSMALLNWAYNNKTSDKPIIISCADNVSQVFDTHYEELRPYYDFFNAGKNGVLTSYMDKQKQVDLAKKIGFIVPESACFSSKEHVCNFSTFPCVVKPLQSYIGGKHIWRCNSSEELQDVINHVPDDVRVQVQELVKNDHEIVLPGLITKDDIYIPGYILKHRDFLGGTTYSSVRKHNVQTEKLVAFSSAMLREIGYEGLFGIEAMFNGNEYVFIELNLRNDATCYSMAVAGVNLPVMYVNYLIGGKNEPKQIVEITSMVENKDFSHVLRRNVSLNQWVNELRGAKCRFLYNKHDMRPLFACLLDQLFNKIHL